jgi:hypothetical protein
MPLSPNRSATSPDPSLFFFDLSLRFPGMARRSFSLITQLALTWSALSAIASAAPTIWTGPTITFAKAGNADPTQSVNQDHLTSLVALTRASTAGMFNIARESAFASTSPKDTLWATNLNNPSQTITASNFAALTFDTWQTAYGGAGSLNTNILNRAAVVHLVTEDIYLNLKFTSFAGGANGGGAFSYQRSTPVPEPSTISAAVIALIGLIALARRSK